MPIKFGEDILENDDFILETDGNGDLVQTHQQTGAQFKFDSTKMRWIPVEGLDLEGADVSNVGQFDSTSVSTDKVNSILTIQPGDDPKPIIEGADNYTRIIGDPTTQVTADSAIDIPKGCIIENLNLKAGSPFDGSNVTMSDHGVLYSDHDDVVIRNCEIDGNRQNVSGNDTSCIHLAGDHCKVINCKVTDADRHGIVFYGSHCRTKINTAIDCVRQGIAHQANNAQSDFRSLNDTVKLPNTGTAAIQIDRELTDAEIKGLHADVHSSAVALETHDHGDPPLEDVTFDDCTTVGGTPFQKNGSNRHKGIKLIDCDFRAPDALISITDADYVRVKGCDVGTGGGIGINNVTNIKVIDTDIPDPGTNQPLDIDGSDTVRVESCYLGGDGGKTLNLTGNSGIKFHDVTAEDFTETSGNIRFLNCDNVSVKDCDFSNFAGTAVMFDEDDGNVHTDFAANDNTIDADIGVFVRSKTSGGDLTWYQIKDNNLRQCNTSVDDRVGSADSDVAGNMA